LHQPEAPDVTCKEDKCLLLQVLLEKGRNGSPRFALGRCAGHVLEAFSIASKNGLGYL
jgi:hypothetical protein